MSDDPVIKSWAITVQTVRAEIFHVPPEDMRRIFQRIEALTAERDRLRTAGEKALCHITGYGEASTARIELRAALKGETP